MENEKLIRNLKRFIEDDIAFFRTCKINEITSRRILIGYYDILDSCIFAIGLTKGHDTKRRNDAIIFLNNIKEAEVKNKFEGFSKLRDELIYCGKDISEIEAKFLIGEINQVIRRLRGKYLKGYA